MIAFASRFQIAVLAYPLASLDPIFRLTKKRIPNYIMAK